MKIQIDTTAQTLTSDGPHGTRTVPLYSDEAFDAISDVWLKVGWNQRYSYTFSWFGRPIIQLPEDIVRTQEVIWRVKPTLIVETGVAHGGSLVYSASLLKAMDIPGRVIGIDIDVRDHNRKAIESHPLAPMISLLIGSSTSPDIVDTVKKSIAPGDRVLVILDSNHTYAHVRDELEAYCGIVTPGSYIVATDGIMRDLADVPHGQADWDGDNPARAAEDFANSHPEFVLEQPAWTFNESGLTKNLTHWPSAWLRRLD